MNFKSVHIDAFDIDECWFKLLSELYTNGRETRIDSGSYAGAKRLEFDFVSATIHNPIGYTEGGVRLPLAVTVPQGVPAPNSESEIEEYFVNYIMDGNKLPLEEYRYSSWIRGGEYSIPAFKFEYEGSFKEKKNFKVIIPDQLEWCIKHFKEKGLANNHCCITIGYPESNLAYDKPYSNEGERGTSPCLRLIDLKVVEHIDENYLCMYVYFRSHDLWGGLPSNFAALALLQEYIAQELNVKMGTFNYSSKGLHCYDFQLEVLKSRLGK